MDSHEHQVRPVQRALLIAGIENILDGLGVDWKNDQHLKETPLRAAKGLEEIYSGYQDNPEELLQKCFEEEDYDQMLVEGPIKAYSMCSHHLLPFTIDVYIGYIPNGKIVGISKFVRVTRAISRRLQVQERITEEIAEVIDRVLEPKGVIVHIRDSSHFCMKMRGVKSETATVSTTSFRGVFETQEARAEFFSTIDR